MKAGRLRWRAEKEGTEMTATRRLGRRQAQSNEWEQRIMLAQDMCDGPGDSSKASGVVVASHRWSMLGLEFDRRVSSLHMERAVQNVAGI